MMVDLDELRKRIQSGTPEERRQEFDAIRIAEEQRSLRMGPIQELKRGSCGLGNHLQILTPELIEQMPLEARTEKHQVGRCASCGTDIEAEVNSALAAGVAVALPVTVAQARLLMQACEQTRIATMKKALETASIDDVQTVEALGGLERTIEWGLHRAGVI